MNRGRALYWTAWIGAALALGLPLSIQAARNVNAQTQAALLADIRVLASDDFQGREPGTPGEGMTLRYLARKWFEIGLGSGTNDPAHEWFAPVVVIAREPDGSTAEFVRKGRRQVVPQATVLMVTSGKRALVRDAPLLFVGRGLKTSLGRTELAGRVAVLLDGEMTDSVRQNELLAAGAAAVLTVLDGERTLENVAAHRKRSGYALADDATGGDLEGFITDKGMASLLKGSAMSLKDLEASAAKPDFQPLALDITASLEATTRETRITTHNLIGKLPGRRPDGTAVLFVAHWDHFGICAEPPAEDLICNGAIDNASGVAALTEVARKLSAAPHPPDRDVYFLATTAEELGLLGAHAFAENPPLPLKRIVAAFNIDSDAIAPKGTPLAIVGRGMTKLDPIIEEVARHEKRKIVANDDANVYAKRQDGWALLQHDVPAVMVESAYGDLPRLEHFFNTDYHRPSDDLKHPIELGGAAEDVDFYVALANWFGDIRKVPAPAQ
jgi:hypothetical protein